MSANRDREEEIFDAAREVTANERAAHLAEVCGLDADLHKQIEGMLEADAAADEFFKTSDAPSPTVVPAEASLSPSIERPGPGLVVQSAPANWRRRHGFGLNGRAGQWITPWNLSQWEVASGCSAGGDSATVPW